MFQNYKNFYFPLSSFLHSLSSHKMVLVHLKGNEKTHEFLYESLASAEIAQLTQSIVDVHNARIRLQFTCYEVKEFLKYGPSRNESLRGLKSNPSSDKKSDNENSDSDDEQDYKNTDEDIVFDADPNAQRIGRVPALTKISQQTLEQTTVKIDTYLDSARCKLRKNGGLTSMAAINELFLELQQNMKQAAIVLPAHDPITYLLMTYNADGNSETDEILLNSEHSHMYDGKTAQLWFTFKKLERGKLLSDYIGTNEKTKIIVKITKAQSHMPVREPVCDEQTRKQMMSFWYKQQESDKALNGDDDESYLRSDWANTSALKQTMLGTQNIRLK